MPGRADVRRPNGGDELEQTLLRHRLHFFDAVTKERTEMVSDVP
jgi:hypothetical protein